MKLVQILKLAVLLLFPAAFLLPGEAFPIAYPKMESASFLMTSSEISSFGEYKSSAHFDTWDIGGQPSPQGGWTTDGRTNSGGGWAYTINLPIWWDKDHDRDGILLAWEHYFNTFSSFTFSDYNALDAWEDPDGDGFTNIQEYLCRTDPTDGTSFLSFTDIRITGSQGMPAVAWWNRTTRAEGYESQYPAYRSTLRFDVLYADWPVQSQATRQFPNDDWFNQTGTWQVVSGASDLQRNQNSSLTTFTDTGSIFVSGMNTGDIRFFRLAVHNSAFEGIATQAAASAGWQYYTNVGSYNLVSTASKEILMLQKHDLVAEEADYPVCALAGTTTGGGGKMDNTLGTQFFQAGALYTLATHINFAEQTHPFKWTIDFLSTAEQWRQVDQSPSMRTITARDGFRFDYQNGLPSGGNYLYLAAQLNMNSYYHEIYRRDWSGQTSTWAEDSNTMYTSIAYTYPVEQRFTFDLNPAFPYLPGSTSHAGQEAFYSDWIYFYRVNLESKGLSDSERVIIYTNNTGAPKWEYFLPISLMGTQVGTELVIQPGTPFVVRQWWNPNDPAAWSAWTMGDDVPYQNSGAMPITNYLKIGY